MISFTLSLIALILGYAIYGRFVARTFGPTDAATPAYTMRDDIDYLPMPTWKIS